MSTSQANPTRPANRQFSLLIALASSERGLTKDDILTSVDGYRQQTAAAGGVTPKLDRMFERDKEDLRDLGVDVETLGDPSAPGDNQLARYRVRSEGPSTAVELDGHEVALLTIASAAWREGALGATSRSGLIKLRARGVDRLRDAPSIAPRLRGGEPQFDAFTSAIAQGRAVTFTYTKQGASSPEHRSVEPLALVQYGGRWLLVGFDLDRGAIRRYLLQRVTDGSIVPGPDIDPERAGARLGRDIGEESLEELRRFAASNPVVIETRRGSDAELLLARRAVGDARGASDDAGTTELSTAPDATGNGAETGVATVRLTIEMADRDLLADELAGFGPELRIVEPPELRDAVRARLRRVLADHDTDESDPSGDAQASPLGEGAP